MGDHRGRPGALDNLNLSLSDKHVEKSATATLNVREQMVDCANTGAITLTMPPVAECAGLLFAIYYGSASANITITSSDAEGWDGNYTLSGAGDGRLLYSDGKRWWPIGQLD